MLDLPIQPFRFTGDTLFLIDQRRLPGERVEVPCTDAKQVHFAIRQMIVRGAPLIGTVAVFGLYLEVRRISLRRSPTHDDLQSVAAYLRNARPTAVNLAWALDRALLSLEGTANSGWAEALCAEALRQEQDNIEWTLAISRHGNELICDGDRVMTICNTGPLATGGYGTALGAILYAHRSGKAIEVYALETRPYLQGARLTAWELLQQGVPVTLITDGMAAWTMKSRQITAVLVGADRIAANGDTANKIGTYGLAVLAAYHRIPLYVVAPLSSFDPGLESGEGILIEERNAEEVCTVGCERIAPEGVTVFNPAFDVTPAALISGFVTETGLLHPPFWESIGRLHVALRESAGPEVSS